MIGTPNTKHFIHVPQSRLDLTGVASTVLLNIPSINRYNYYPLRFYFSLPLREILSLDFELSKRLPPIKSRKSFSDVAWYSLPRIIPLGIVFIFLNLREDSPCMLKKLLKNRISIVTRVLY